MKSNVTPLTVVVSAGRKGPGGAAARALRARGRAVGLLVMMGVLCACAGGGQADTPAGSVRFQPANPDESGLIALVTQGRDPTLIHEAMYSETERCMLAAGFDFEASVVVGDASRARVEVERSVLFGLPSNSVATDLGLASTQLDYAAEMELQSAAARRAFTQLEQQGEAYVQRFDDTLSGVGEFEGAAGHGKMMRPDGCNAKGLVAVFGDIGTGLRLEFLTGELRELAGDRAYASENVSGALAGWADCMQRNGHDVEDPRQLYRQLESEQSPEADGFRGERRAADLERSATRAMIECDAESNLYGVGWKELPAVIQRLQVERAADIEAYRAALDRAEAILGG